jgi:acetyl esterase/lipase
MTTGEAVPLWEGVAPGSETWNQQEREWTLPAGVDITTLWNVVQPTLTPVLPDPAVATGTGVVVVPGGAYIMLAIGHEGFDVAEWLAARGVAAFVLKYRVMETPDSDDGRMQALVGVAEQGGLSELLRRMDEFASIPLADGDAALRLVHDRAEEWGVRPGRIGAVGFSAGARLVLDLITQDAGAVRPAFAGAIYGPGSDRAVPADAPPLFAAVAGDDPFVDGLIQTQAAWRAAGRSVEAHLYARGGHGFGMNRQGLPADQWIEQFLAWMASEGFVG